MAFRLGHQISCNIKQNPIFRSLSVDSSRRFKSSQNITFNKKQNGCCCIYKEKKIHLPRARSLPSEHNASSFSYRMFSSKKPPDAQTNDAEYVTEYNPQQPYTSENNPVLQGAVELVMAPRVTHPELQPSNCNPLVDSQIRQMATTLNSPIRTRRQQVAELKRLAVAKYEKAVKTFNSENGSDIYRYQLEAAKPKSENLNDAYTSLKRRYERETGRPHQLQPKNIKPYGNMDTPHWTGPNVENFKPSVVLQDLRRHRFETIIEKRSSSSERQSDPPKALPSRTQHRDYCTIPEKLSTQVSPELEKCKAIIAEYKNLNPGYSGKTTKIAPGSEEEKKLLEETEKLVTSVKNSSKPQNITSPEPTITSYPQSSSRITSKASDSIKDQQPDDHRPQTLQTEKSSSAPVLNLPQPSNTKVLLFYDEKKKKLCSKVIKNTNSNQLFEEQLDDEFANKIKVRVAPKLMLQSSDLNDPHYKVEDLKPAANEKFVAPWLCWSDRVKMQAKDAVRTNSASVETLPKDTEDISQKNNSKSGVINVNCINTAYEGKKRSEIQKRLYSWRPTVKDFKTAYKSFLCEPKIYRERDQPQSMKWTDVWGKCNGNLKNNDTIYRSNSDGTNRSFTTECTRGVLGPEATVMVKLRRLPKINLPEPEKDCPGLKKEPCYRADGEIRVAQKKLPKLVMQPCRVPTRFKLRSSPSIPRLKMRNVPVEPPKICPTTQKCGPLDRRADDGMLVPQKKLPKLVMHDCFPITERKMTSRPLPRLVARPMPPPPPCIDRLKFECPPRADEGLKITRKKLPPIKMADCCPVCPPGMVPGEPLKRLKKVHIPEPRKSCLDIIDLCPPRADEVTGYKVRKKRLRSLILGEKYNNMSWKDFNSKRNFASDSKCNMCCFSDKIVQPDIKIEKNHASSEWSKFKGRLLCKENGKLAAYLPPEEIVDTSTGTELKIVKKPIGTSFRKDEHLHEELLKGGFTSLNTSDRKYCSSSEPAPCPSAPVKTPYKDLRLRRLKKRKGFEKDFPGKMRSQKFKEELECIDECSLMERMDDVVKYTVKSKKLPPIPKGGCVPTQRKIPKEAKSLMRRPKKKHTFKSYDCPKLECVDHCPPRADEQYVEKYNKLVPMHEISKTCKPLPKPVHDGQDVFKPLKKVVIEEPVRCVPPVICNVEITRSDSSLRSSKRKSLPPLNFVRCPRPKPRQMKPIPKLRRLPAPPHQDRVRKHIPDCVPDECYLSDEMNHYEVKPKKLKSFLKRNNRAFSTLPVQFLYKENFHNFESNRHFSSTTILLNSEKKECKKLAQQVTTKKCPKVNLTDCKPAKSISCARMARPRLPCAKQKSPYPAFSECQDHQRPDVITECRENDKMLQPRWPILNEIQTQKPPPPYQGKIDPTKQEECIAKKLSIERDGGTKTCENFDEPDKSVLTKEMYDEVMRSPPYDECECANEGQKVATPKNDDGNGPCKPKDLSVCPDPDIECVLNEKPASNIACVKTEDESQEERGIPGGKVIGKLTCRKKGAGEECDEEDAQEDPCKEAPKAVIAKQSAKEECVEKAPKSQKPSSSKVQKQSKECEKPPSDCEEIKAKCESEKASNKTKTGSKEATGKCEDKKAIKKTSAQEKKEGDDKKGTHCRNVKPCGGKGGKKRTKVKKVRTKRRTPKKCSDLLKEEDNKMKKKAPRSAKKKPQMADLCKKKPCTPKVCKSKAQVKKTAAKVPPKKSLWQRIIDFFKARPNCPAPDQWKKDKLMKQAQRAAAAAGLELCEKKKPKEVKVDCKKSGIRRTSGRKKVCSGRRKECKKIPSPCGAEKAQPKKTTSKTDTKSSDKCKKIKQDCGQSKGSEKKAKTGSAPKKPPQKPPTDQSDDCGKAQDECKPKVDCKSDKAKTSAKARSSEKLDECKTRSSAVEEETCEDECIEEEEKGTVRMSGKCKVFPKQKFCQPRARKNCVTDVTTKECTPQESPYACYSECKKDFPKIPMTECSEQDKNVKRKTVTYDYDDPSKQQTKNYSTLAFQRRSFSSNSSGGNTYDPLALFGITNEESSSNNVDKNELVLKILAMVKDGMKNTTTSQSTRANYVDIFKELESLCEHELSKNLAKDATSNAHSKFELLSGVNLGCKNAIPSQTNFLDMEHRVMMETAKNFCKTMFLMPDSSTKEYEETERIKTEELRKKLDEMLNNYKQ